MGFGGPPWSVHGLSSITADFAGRRPTDGIRYGGKNDTAWPVREDMAGKKIRRGRREKIWREKRYGVAGAKRMAGKKIWRGRREKILV